MKKVLSILMVFCFLLATTGSAFASSENLVNASVSEKSFMSGDYFFEVVEETDVYQKAKVTNTVTGTIEYVESYNEKDGTSKLITTTEQGKFEFTPLNNNEIRVKNLDTNESSIVKIIDNKETLDATDEQTNNPLLNKTDMGTMSSGSITWTVYNEGSGTDNADLSNALNTASLLATIAMYSVGGPSTIIVGLFLFAANHFVINSLPTFWYDYKQYYGMPGFYSMRSTWYYDNPYKWSSQLVSWVTTDTYTNNTHVINYK